MMMRTGEFALSDDAADSKKICQHIRLFTVNSLIYIFDYVQHNDKVLQHYSDISMYVRT